MTVKKKVLVTGANGLLGRITVKHLSSFYDVHALVRVMPRECINNIKYHVVDLSKDWRIKDLPKTIDIIIHLAQSSEYRGFPESALHMYKVNIDSSARLLDYARLVGVKHFIYASSGGVYGSRKGVFDESSPIINTDELGYYLSSKFCSEILASSYSNLMQISILRIFFMYGPRQKKSMLIPRLVDCIHNNRPIMLQGEDGICINPIHVNDACMALKSVLKMDDSTVYNIAGLETFSIREIGDMIGNILGKESIYEHTSNLGQDLIGSTSTMEKKLHTPQISLQEGIYSIING